MITDWNTNFIQDPRNLEALEICCSLKQFFNPTKNYELFRMADAASAKSDKCMSSIKTATITDGYLAATFDANLKQNWVPMPVYFYCFFD